MVRPRRCSKHTASMFVEPIHATCLRMEGHVASSCPLRGGATYIRFTPTYSIGSIAPHSSCTMDIFDADRDNPPDYRHYRKDNATVMPAIHSSYMQYSSKDDVQNVLLKHNFSGFGDFNFLSQDGAYVYDAALYSAGGAELNIEKSKQKTPGIWDRRPDTTLMSDSGGFQVYKGLWSPREYYDKREKILRWQEEISDIGIAMDVPSGSVSSKKAKAIRTFDDALHWSKINFDWQVRNRRPEKMRLLNVVQGLKADGPTGVMRWYDEVKRYCNRDKLGDQAFDGWSFGGYAARNTKTLLRVISRMRNDGLLGKKSKHRWIHILGVTSIKRVATFTLLQRALRKLLDDDEFTISCDSSNPCFAVGTKGNYYGEGPPNIIQRKVLHAAWFEPSCGLDCRVHCTPTNSDCGPCVEERLKGMFGFLGTSTVNIRLFQAGCLLA